MGRKPPELSCFDASLMRIPVAIAGQERKQKIQVKLSEYKEKPHEDASNRYRAHRTAHCDHGHITETARSGDDAVHQEIV